jgi:ATP-binding cassette subfamily B (MDR/TAP) protein 1
MGPAGGAVELDSPDLSVASSDTADSDDSGSETSSDFLLSHLSTPEPCERTAAQSSDSDSDIDPLLATVRCDFVNALVSHVSVADPKSYRLAAASPDSAKWLAATREECDSILENNTWTLVDKTMLPRGARPMRSKFIYKTKHDSDGGVERFKARLVVQGFSQREGVDFDEVFAPVAHHATIRVVIAVAAAQRMLVHQMDVKTAFLIPELKEELYMELPDGWPSELPGSREHHVCRLNKALYGLKQAPRYWNQRLNQWMLSQAFSRSQSDPCLYIKKLLNGSFMYVTVWVDDLLIACGSLADIKSFKQAISAEFKMKDLGEAHFCLGMRIRCDGQGRISIDQER